MDEAAFDAFYNASFARLVRQTYAVCGNLAEAQDCVQEAFVRAWDRRRELDEARSPEAWVRTVAHRLAVSRWRKAVRAFRSPDRAVEERSSREPSPDKVVLQQAMAQLPYEQRRALVLHYIADLSIDDIAEEVGAPSGTIKARLSRGRKALASLLGDESEVRHA